MTLCHAYDERTYTTVRYQGGASSYREEPAIGVLTQRIREEFDEAPGLQITVEEGVRFWVLDAETCANVLSALHQTGFLVRAQDGRYQRSPAT